MSKTQCLPLSCWLDKAYVEKNNTEITDGYMFTVMVVILE